MEVRFLLGTKAVASNHRFHPSGDHPPFDLAVRGPEALRPERELMAERPGGLARARVCGGADTRLALVHDQSGTIYGRFCD